MPVVSNTRHESQDDADFIAFLVWRIVVCPQRIIVPAMDSPLPWTGISKWVAILFTDVDLLPLETVSLALLYLKRFCSGTTTKDFTTPPPRFSNLYVKRIFITSLVLAMKWHDDDSSGTFAWAVFCKEMGINGISKDDLNGMERQFLVKLKWNLHISESQFDGWSTLIFEDIYVEYLNYLSERLAGRQKGH